ncbi:MAG: response regulator [Actinomycetota bacterium]
MTTNRTEGLIRVVIVDDHPLVADGLAALLNLEPDVDVVGSASTVDAGCELISREEPDVVVCDIQIGDRSGFALLERFAGGAPAFVMFSSHDHPAYHKAAFEGGASGFVLKDGSSSQLLDTIRAAAAGRMSFSLRTLQTVRHDVHLPSARELQIIGLVADGRSNDEIARDLSIRPKTVESHLRTLFDRHRVMSRTELALHAVREGWIRSSERRAIHGPGGPGGPGQQQHAGGWIADRETLGALTGRPAGRAKRENRGRSKSPSR